MKLAPMAISLLIAAGMLMPPCFALNGEWQALNDQGEALFKAKQYSNAENMFIKARTFAEERQLKEELAKTLFDLAWMYDKQNRLLEEEGIFYQLLALKKQLSQDSTLEIGRIYRGLGNTQIKLKKYTEGHASLLAAYEIYKSKVGRPARINEDVKALISVINELANACALNNRTAEATALHNESLALIAFYHLPGSELSNSGFSGGGWDGNDLRSDAQ